MGCLRRLDIVPNLAEDCRLVESFSLHWIGFFYHETHEKHESSGSVEIATPSPGSGERSRTADLRLLFVLLVPFVVNHSVLISSISFKVSRDHGWRGVCCSEHNP